MAHRESCKKKQKYGRPIHTLEYYGQRKEGIERAGGHFSYHNRRGSKRKKKFGKNETALAFKKHASLPPDKVLRKNPAHLTEKPKGGESGNAKCVPMDVNEDAFPGR